MAYEPKAEFGSSLKDWLLVFEFAYFSGGPSLILKAFLLKIFNEKEQEFVCWLVKAGVFFQLRW